MMRIHTDISICYYVKYSGVFPLVIYLFLFYLKYWKIITSRTGSLKQWSSQGEKFP